MEPLADSWRFFIAPSQPGPKSGKKDTMPGRAPRRYKMDENGTVRSAFHGKLPEEFTERDMLAFAADTDLLLFQKVSEETLAAIHAAGYDYQGGAVIPRPGKEETDMAEQETKFRRWKNSRPVLPIFSH